MNDFATAETPALVFFLFSLGVGMEVVLCTKAKNFCEMKGIEIIIFLYGKPPGNTLYDNGYP